MPLPTRITLPPSGRPVGGLLAASRPIPAGDWQRGVVFASGQCVAPQNVGACTDGDTTKVPQDLSDAAGFDPFAVVVALQCSTMGRTAIEDFASESLQAVREYAVASEFLTGAASGNPSLADADVLGIAAANAAEAMACLEQHASSVLSGRLVFLHVAPLLASKLAEASAIYREGRTWYTATGNIVVISPGYDGREPGGLVPGAGDPLFIYATGEVYTATGTPETLLATERGQNTLQAIAEDTAIAVFDPCFNVAMDTGVNACDVTPVS